MGLQGQLSDVASDSIPLLLLSLLAACFAHLRSSLSAALHSLGFSLPPRPSLGLGLDDPAVLTSLGSGLAGLIAIADISRALSATFSSSSGSGSSSSDRCIVCLCGFKEGDAVRRLPCRHVFHRPCFDGWLDRRNFTCPLCRAPLLPPERVDRTALRVGSALVDWFSPR